MAQHDQQSDHCDERRLRELGTLHQPYLVAPIHQRPDRQRQDQPGKLAAETAAISSALDVRLTANSGTAVANAPSPTLSIAFAHHKRQYAPGSRSVGVVERPSVLSSPSDALLARLQGDAGSGQHICDEDPFAVGVTAKVVMFGRELDLQIVVSHGQVRVSSQRVAKGQPL